MHSKFHTRTPNRCLIFDIFKYISLYVTNVLLKFCKKLIVLVADFSAPFGNVQGLVKENLPMLQHAVS